MSHGTHTEPLRLYGLFVKWLQVSDVKEFISFHTFSVSNPIPPSFTLMSLVHVTSPFHPNCVLPFLSFSLPFFFFVFLYFSTLLASLYVYFSLYIYAFPWFRYIFPSFPVFNFICSSNLLFPFSISFHSFVFCFHLVSSFGFSSVSSILSFPFLILSNLSVHYISRK